MERLTSYDEIGNKIEDCKNIVLIPKTPLLDEHYRGKAIDRLAEFEDFMEDNDIEEIEELQEIIERDKFEHLITYPFEQKIQALEDRWNKLKEYVVEEFEKDNKNGCVDFACVEEDILDKMRKLEWDSQNER